MTLPESKHVIWDIDPAQVPCPLLLKAAQIIDLSEAASPQVALQITQESDFCLSDISWGGGRGMG